MMKNKKIKVVESFLVIGMLTIMLSSFVCAIGYSYGYHPVHNPLQVYPGETKIINIPLKTARADEYVAKATLVDNGGIASIDESKEYIISSSKTEIVAVTLNIPEDAVVGSDYIVEIKFYEVDPPEVDGGTIGLTASSATLNMRASVIEAPEEPEGIGTGWIVLAIVVIIVVIIIIWFVAKSSKVKAGNVGKPVKSTK